ncbi:YggT family protein [Vagococcus entomophilus]|uniref:YggT family protein n=1 Tax=Vagococcus entomophilus TaxID=1160095 RepID=A0A430AL06_9ENTE|nr:YggT family protein [Vagococcus entomophilus]
MIGYAVRIYSLCLVAYALLSWLPGGYDSPIGKFLNKVCEPYLRLFDRFNLSIGSIGFNIMVGLFVLNIVGSLLQRILYGL